MRYFCTYFDHRYLPRGLALYRSLEAHCPSFTLWVLCLDRAAYDVLTRMDLPHLRPVPLDEFEKEDADLLAPKGNRSLVEYYFTCTAAFLWYLFRRCPEVDVLTYLDADLYFFADPEPVFDEMAGGSVVLVEHHFSARLPGWEKYGKYNVGWVSFRRDGAGLACLCWWRERCLEWCYDRVEGERFADQKYLDQWPGRFPGVVVVRQKGADLAPWNFVNYRLREKKGRVWVDDDPLVFYHFHDLKQVNRWVYDPCLRQYRCRLTRVLARHVYAPYIRVLEAARREVGQYLPGAGLTNRYDLDDLSDGSVTGRRSLLWKAARGVKRLVRAGVGVLGWDYVLMWDSGMTRDPVRTVGARAVKERP